MADKEKLFYTQKNVYDLIGEDEKKKVNKYSEDYKAFITEARTERECVASAVRLAEAKGFKSFEPGMPVKAGEKYYRINRGKALMLAVIGEKGLEQGMNIAAAHIDSPRLDL